MRDLILNIILHNWDKYIFPGIKMKSFFVDIYKFLTMLDVICLDDSYSIAIHSSRSRQWIALYLACYIKGVDFVVLSPNLERDTLFNTLNHIATHYLFIEQRLVSFNRTDMFRIPFLKGAYDIDTIKPISLRSDVYNDNISHLSLNTLDDTFIDENIVLRLLEKYSRLDQESCVLNMTSGVSHTDTKLTLSSDRSILETVTKGFNVLPYHVLHTVYSEVEFAHSHIITVLIPFVKGCAFSETAEGADVIIESTETFEQKWYEEVESIFEAKFFYWLFKKRIFKGLFSKVAGRLIRKFYANFEHVIIYNGSVQERALNIAKRYLPLHVTYGSQETNQLMACNDFSAPAYRRPGDIGRPIGVITINKHGELRYESEGVFELYLGDEPHTRYIRDVHRSRVLSGDNARIQEGSIILKGRMASVHKYNDRTVNLDELERHFRSHPYIEECVLIPWKNNGVHLLVRVNQRLVEAHKMGVLEVTHILEKFYNAFKNDFEKHVVLANVSVSHEPFPKSFDGKIRIRSILAVDALIQYD